MQLSIYGKSLELTPALRAYVQQRLDKLERFFPGAPPPAQVALSVQRDRQTVEVTIPFEGMILRAEDSESSMYAAVDLVLDKLERQIEKFKTRELRRHHRHSAAPAPSPLAPDPAGTAPPQPGPDDAEALVREKRFLLKPMTVEEALLQMTLLGHDFFVFREAGSEELRVVYRRRHGGYGLIVAE